MARGDITEIYIELLDEGTPTLIGTTSIDLGNGTYKVLPSKRYDPEDQVWEFPPGTIVRGEYVKNGKMGTIFFAVAKVK
ncbi:MAG: hypothetical protein EB060_05710 [Proteobacteria bacterium]|nr:hypothetical protein [Pseudomonadota bacterium]